MKSYRNSIRVIEGHFFPDVDNRVTIPSLEIFNLRDPPIDFLSLWICATSNKENIKITFEEICLVDFEMFSVPVARGVEIVTTKESIKLVWPL